MAIGVNFFSGAFDIVIIWMIRVSNDQRVQQQVREDDDFVVQYTNKSYDGHSAPVELSKPSPAEFISEGGHAI